MRLLRSTGDITAVDVTSWRTCDRRRTDTLAPKHQTGKLLLHRLVLGGVDKGVHADVDVRQEHGGVVAGKHVAGCLVCGVDNEEIEGYREPANDKSDTHDYHRLDGSLLVIFLQ